MNALPRFAAPLLLLSLGFGALAASGQPSGFMPARTEVDFSAGYFRVADTSVSGAADGARVGIASSQLRIGASTRIGNGMRLLYGLGGNRHELDLTRTTCLPKELESIALLLGVAYVFDDRWSLLVSATPRLAGADRSLSTARFDLPVLALASYVQSPEVTWSFGLRYGARSEIAVLPIAGVAWRFAPAWELKVGWPESGVSWRATEQLTLRAVATINGGDYRLAADPRTLAERVGPSLADTWLEYREIRVGLAAEYAFSRTFSLRADIGQVVDQRFEYIDRDLKLNGESPLYFGCSVVGQF
jgi:hypothetical protein